MLYVMLLTQGLIMKNDHLVIKNLRIQFSKNNIVVNNISFTIRRGQTVALVGESGSGKSITALAITQLLPSKATLDVNSQIILDGEDLLNKSELQMRKIRGRRIATVFQEASTALNPVLTIGQQIEEVLKAHIQLEKKARKSRALSLLEEVGLSDSLGSYDAYPHQLSGGMKQRAMIAIALACEPELLIADEPTTALDVTIQAQVLQLFKKIQKKHNMSLLFITHNLAIVYHMADYVVVMRQGEIVEQAEAQSFFNAPQHDYSKELFAAIPGINLIKQEQVKKDTEKTPFMTVEDLRIYFPIKKGLFKRTVGYVKAVDGINLTLYKGKTLALVGESGSGKTTTGMGLMRLYDTSGGCVNYNGVNLNGLSNRQFNPYRRDFQIIFQDPYSSMNPRMMIYEIIEEGMLAQNIGGNKQSRDKRICELLELVGLNPDMRFRYPHEFSGGQRQRICISRALAMEPKFIVCDEPTSALDVSVQMTILKLLLRLQHEFDLTYLLITHDLSVVSGFADDVAVMYHGKIVESGTIDSVMNNPQHEYTKKLLAAVPEIEFNLTGNLDEQESTFNIRNINSSRKAGKNYTQST